MSQKTFKTGEYGYSFSYKLITRKEGIQINHMNSEKKVTESRFFLFDNCEYFNEYMEQETTCYYASLMFDWMKHTKEYVKALIPSQPY